MVKAGDIVQAHNQFGMDLVWLGIVEEVFPGKMCWVDLLDPGHGWSRILAEDLALYCPGTDR